MQSLAIGMLVSNRKPLSFWLD